MKFIGQHIFDYIARFRNDVFLEDISTGTIASGGNLGLDANNKIVKADTEAGELSFNGSTANGVLTYGNATTIDVESTFTYDSATSLVNIINSAPPQVNLDFSGSGVQGPKLLFNMSQASGSDNDILGTIVWKGKNDSGSGSLTTFANLDGRIEDASAGDEAGELKLTVLTNSTENRQALTATGLGTSSRVDVSLGHGATSTTTTAGSLEANGKITVTNDGQLFFNNTGNTASTRLIHSTASTTRSITLPDADGTVLLKDNVNPGKQFQVFQTNFTDDIKTDEVFIPLHGTTFEQTSQFADDVAILAPCDGRIVSLDLNILAVTGSSDLTVTIYSCPPGIPGIFLTEWTEEENEVISIQSTDDSHVFHFAFDNAKHFESTEKFALSIQSSADIMGNTLIYATAVVEFDYSTLLPATSAEFDSAP